MDMVTGIVKSNWNKDFPGKIQVEYRFGEEGTCLSGWMPVMTGYGGPGYGSYHLPETGSEVIVAFLHGNPDSPFVAGCLWGGVNTLPEGAALEKNSRKQLKTKDGWQFLLDEEKHSLSVTDSKGENRMVLSSEEGTLTLDIKTKMEIKIDGENFLIFEKGKLTAATDWEIKAKKLTVTAENGMKLGGKTVELAPTDGVVIQGQKAEIKAVQTTIQGTSLEVKGTASAKVEASGILELKGTMVKIN